MQAPDWYPWYFAPEYGGIMGSYGFMPTAVGGGWGNLIGNVLGQVAGSVLGRYIPGQLPAESPPIYPASRNGKIAIIDPNTGAPITYSVSVIERVADQVAAEKKRRHMNPCNPRALRRALCRTHRFAHFAKSVIKVERRFKQPRRRRSCRK